MQPLDDFFSDIDRLWPDAPVADIATPIQLDIIGSTALMLQTSYRRNTKDSDILEANAVTPRVRDRLRSLAGPSTALAHRHRIYLDIVGGGVPFLPQVPIWHPATGLDVHLQHFEVRVLDVIDVVVGKLKRLHANDRADIEAMVSHGRVDHDRLIERFRLAVDVFAYDARAPDIPRYVDNLHRERDILLVDETEITWPQWG